MYYGSITGKNYHTHMLSVCELKGAADTPAVPDIPEMLEHPVPPQKVDTAPTGSGAIPLRFIRTVWEHFEQGLPAGLSRPVTPSITSPLGSGNDSVPFLTRWKIIS